MHRTTYKQDSNIRYIGLADISKHKANNKFTLNDNPYYMHSLNSDTKEDNVIMELK